MDLGCVARALALLFMCSAMGGFALAHADLTRSEPGIGETVSAGLKSITLTFSQPVRVTVVKVIRLDDSSEIPSKRKGEPAFNSDYALEIEALKPGGYQVDWTAVAQDGHIMNGRFEFLVAE